MRPSITASESACLLNREILSPEETALVERLIPQCEELIISECQYDPFNDPEVDQTCLQYLVVKLLQRNFARIINQTQGLKSANYGNLAVVYDLQEDLSRFDMRLLDRYRKICIG